MTSAVIDCSVLVPVLNEAHAIRAAVAGMQRQAFDGQLEFIFADGGSTDGTVMILSRLAEQDPRIRIVANPRQTVSSGLNVALARARGTYAVRMDAHSVYPQSYVALGVARLQRGGTRWVSGPPNPTGEGLISRAVALALGGAIGRGGSRKWSGAQESEFELDTGVFAGVWERATLLEYGGWDERWRVNEDAELAARFLERGEALVCLPQMAADYLPRDTLGGLWSQYAGYGRFRARTARSHPISMRRSQLLPTAVVVTAGCAVGTPRVVRRPARAALGAYAATLVRSAFAARRSTDHAVDAAVVPVVPVVLAVMHVSYGSGQLHGWLVDGPPLAAFARLLGAHRLARRLALPPEPVHAPSFNGGC